MSGSGPVDWPVASIDSRAVFAAFMFGKIVLGYARSGLGVPLNGMMQSLFFRESSMLDINPLTAQIHDLKGRLQSLRGYL